MKAAPVEPVERCQLAMLTSSSDTNTPPRNQRAPSGSGYEMQDQTTEPESDAPPRLCGRPCPLCCLFMRLRSSSLAGVNVMEHALKCLLRSLLFPSVRLCVENRGEGGLRRGCAKSQSTYLVPSVSTSHTN